MNTEVSDLHPDSANRKLCKLNNGNNKHKKNNEKIRPEKQTEKLQYKNQQENQAPALR